LLFANTVLAQSESPNMPGKVLPLFDSATVWEGVRIKTATVFGEKNVERTFKIKNKKKRAALVAALEGQFQVNIGEAETRSLKRAGNLANNIFQAQRGMVMFSKASFQGKIERIATDRKDCGDSFDCLNFIGSVIVPQGLTVTLFNKPKFQGEQMVIDATRAEVRIASFFKIDFSETISTTNKAVNWREDVRSVRVKTN
jgi:hypothetical protein